MDYIGETVAVGMVMMDDEGYDAMRVIHGTIQKHDNMLCMVSEGHEPFEMSPKWLEKLKLVQESMGPEFQGSKYCLIIGSLQKPN